MATHSDSETLLYLFGITSAQVWGHNVDIEHRSGWYDKRCGLTLQENDDNNYGDDGKRAYLKLDEAVVFVLETA
jgi:hypothetical protein